MPEKIGNYNGFSFKEFITSPIPADRIKEVRANVLDRIRIQQERISSIDIDLLRATGEYPIRTPYDALLGEDQFLPVEIAARALITRHFDLETLLHPDRIEGLKKMTKLGFTPVREKKVEVRDYLGNLKRIPDGITFDDLGFPAETEAETEKNLGHVPDASARSANSLMGGSGLFSWTNPDLPTLPFVLSSTPDVVGAHTLTTITAAQGIGFIPMDSIWTDWEKQVAMYRRVIELLEEEPVLKNHPDRDYLLRRAQRLVGVTLKSDPRDAVKRAKRLYDEGVRTFRIYDPRSQQRLFEAVDGVRQELGNDVIIFAGQVIDSEQAYRLKEKGASSLIVGIGEGGICNTPGEAALAVNNLKQLSGIVESNVGIPVIIDGGVGQKSLVAFGLGARGAMKSQAIARGIEKPPFLQWILLSDGRYASLYSGEAAPRIKYLGGKLDRLGRPIFAEGSDNYTIFNPNIPSMATILYYLLQSLATASVFRHMTIDELQRLKNVTLIQPSSAAKVSAAVHHDS